MTRCAWAGGNPLMADYHDREWGTPVHDDRKLFEYLVLDTHQAGLSWLIILRKREGYREAFAEFDAEAVARYTEADVERLLQFPGIVRNRAKIEATLANARCVLAVCEELGSLDRYLWQFVGGRPIDCRRASMDEIPTESEESRAISKDMRKRGFRFVGPTTLYAFMQGVGMVNDHTVDCFRYAELAAAGR